MRSLAGEKAGQGKFRDPTAQAVAGKSLLLYHAAAYCQWPLAVPSVAGSGPRPSILIAMHCGSLLHLFGKVNPKTRWVIVEACRACRCAKRSPPRVAFVSQYYRRDRQASGAELWEIESPP